jgi:carbamoyl-phosphate synthase small subunit
MKSPALLALENGMTFSGFGFGDLGAEAAGEVVFNTAITGYQEIMSDPSYKGQIMTFTYPHIGNYGINEYDMESGNIQTEGLIVKECSPTYSNWRATTSLQKFLEKDGRIGIEGIDTRSLVRVLRSQGVMRGIISAKDTDPSTLIERARALPSMEGLDLTGAVTCTAPYIWPASRVAEPLEQPASLQPRRVYRVAAMDFGIKKNILRRLSLYGCEVHVFPATATAREITDIQPDGIFLSNGPGDPAAATQAIQTISQLVQTGIPTFGICLGHQLLGLVFGARTYKLRFGHRGANHPVKNLLNGIIEISSQNHGFAVDPETLPPDIEATHINLNDSTLSGLRHRRLPVFSVQYHPEAAPGPHDSDYLFRQFIELMEAHKS